MTTIYWCSKWRVTSGSTSGLCQERAGKDCQKESDIGRRGPHGTCLEDEATQQFMAVLVIEGVYLMRRRIRTCSSSNRRDSKDLLNEKELAGGLMLQLMRDVNTMSLDRFQADVLAKKEQYERSDAILGGMEVGWMPYFLSSCYPMVSRNLVASFIKDIRKRNCRLG